MENPSEVKEIRNKLRMMKFPQDEIVNTVRRQQRAIHKQSLANETLKKEIIEYEKEIANLDHQLEQFKSNEQLQRANADIKRYTNQLSVITADLAAEEQKRKKLDDEVSKANSKAGGFFKQSKENSELQARLRTVENRLDKALLRYNGNLGKLSDQRTEIDELRKNRSVFKDIIRHTEQQIEESDQKMATLISSSNQAYSERDRMKMDLVQLKQAEEEDIKNFDEEYTRLSQQIEGHKITQNRPRDQQQTVPSLNSQLGSQSDQAEEITAQTEHLQGRIDQTLKLCGFQTYEELLQAADAIERENFSLYNFVVEHGANKTKLQDEIDALELQHDSLLQQINKNDGEQRDSLENLTSDIKNVDEDLQESLEEAKKNDEEAQAVNKEIEDLFNELQCSWENSPDEHDYVTTQNAMFCLSNIEVAMAEMMNFVAEKVKLVYQMRGTTDLTTIVSNEQSDNASMKPMHTKALDKDQIKLPDTSKPLSVEEMMQLLNNQ